MASVLVLGSGDVASAVAHALFLAGHSVVLHDEQRPPHARRGMAFVGALFDGTARLEGVLGKRAKCLEDVLRMVQCRRAVPLADIDCTVLREQLRPDVLVDARMRKRAIPEALRGLAPITIGLGPNFVAGGNVDVAVETAWGARLGTVLRSGSTQTLEGEPRALGGHGRERFVYAPAAGTFRTHLRIGDRVEQGEQVGQIGEVPVRAPLSGWLRGLSHDGAWVAHGTKVLEVDARDDPASFQRLGERPRRIAEGVLAALADTRIG
jgi:xanthine dehydrogenase accessory factor